MKTYDVYIEDRVGNIERVIVKAKNGGDACDMACEYAELNCWGDGDWQATTFTEGVTVITMAELNELKGEE